MNITRLAIDYNRVTWVVLALTIITGVKTFYSMPRAYDPGFIVRTAQVLTYFPGASPERVEKLVTSQIEDVAKEIPELDFVQSESRTGISIVLVNIRESYTEMRPIWDDLRRKVEDIRDDLPEGIVGPYVNDDFGDVYGIVLALRGEGLTYAEMERIAEQAKDELLLLPDVAKVDILGEQEERIFVEYNNARLAELGISPYQLSQMLSARNIVSSGGSFVLDKERISLEPTGNFESVTDIGNTVIPLPGSDRLVMLRDIANISRGFVDPPSSRVHYQGERALALAVSMREGGNNIELGQRVRTLLAKFQNDYPYGVEFNVINFSPDEVQEKVSDFVKNLGQAVAVVTLVMLIFLGLRTGLVVAVLIPTTMLLSLVVMDNFAIGLDQISLAALMISLGMLVDNGIVMTENILVRMERGEAPLCAALTSANELRLPLLTASLTTAAAFLPIYLAESAMGEFTAALFQVVTITLLCSWLIALTIIPMLCVTFLRIKKRDQIAFAGLHSRYRQLLTWLLHHRAATLLATLVMFVLGIALTAIIPKLFFPTSDRSYFVMEMEFPTGYALESTEQKVAELERFLASELQVNEQRPEGITNWAAYIGNSGPRFILTHAPKPASNNWSLIVANTTGSEVIDELMAKIQAYADDHFPDLNLGLKRVGTGPPISNPVEVRLTGRNTEQLFALLDRVRQRMRQHPGLQNVSDDWGQRIKKLSIDIDQVRARLAGVTSQDIAVSLQSGVNGLELTEYRENEETIPVVLRTTGAASQSIHKVESLSVYAQSTGTSVPLSQVADVKVVWDNASVHRRDGLRTVTVGAQLTSGANAAAITNELNEWLVNESELADSGVSFEFGGDSEQSSKSNDSIMAKVGTGGMIILMILVVQFNSIRKPLIIISTIPLGLIGVFLGLFVTGSYIGFMTILGVVSLAGIVINNAIVLLERIQLNLADGMDHHQAIIDAAEQRARPILLTTATTVLGLLPLYYGGGAMWEPMSLTIMSGLIFSTILTLGVVPVLYATLYKVRPATKDVS
ncbi:efflux RND transporter permease subunit [Halioxenophilus sp. WMMB6]|uniref:efflux RND transporter permease subunit n=1 Tax=Halioxenophilus sp. WMMB6 TaxID=3073815 RepID=UPI00295F0BCC|nr:efflux RND transporter permease subunit [Halioxenophilus sp. WMMB6]